MKKKKMTRREFLKTAGVTGLAVSSSMGFPGVLKYGLGEVPIKLGTCLSLSGTMSTQGEDMADATKMAVEEINAKGGLLGRKVELCLRDDAANPALAATRAKELIEKEKVNFMAGANTGATVHAQHQQTAPKKILYMANAMSNDITAVPMFSKYSFHPDITPWMLANVMGRFTAEKLGKRWYFVFADYAYGWQTYESFSAVLKEYKGENLGISPHPLGASDYSTYIGRIMAAQPEVLISISPGRDQINSWKQFRDFGIFEKMKVATSIFIPSQIWSVGVEAVLGGYGGTTFYWEAPETRQHADAFWKMFGRPPTDDGSSQYECVMEIFSAVERAKSLDSDKLVKELEGHKFKWAKTEEYWRAGDHQAIQDIYVLEPKKPSGKYGIYDTFTILDRKGGEQIVKTCEEQGHKKDAKGNWIRYQ